MKKLFVLGLSLALVAGGMSSCKKTNAGKFSNDWKVTKYESKDLNTYSSGDKDEETVTMEGDKYTEVSSTTSGGNTTTATKNGTVKEFAYTINKDGSWSSVLDFTTTDSGVEVHKNIEASGTWYFLSKNKTSEFKKNEKVVFSTLKYSQKTDVTTTLGTTSTAGTDTYADGESVEVFLIKESKKKSLVLESESNTSSTDNSGTDTWTNKTTITMEQK